MRKNPFDQINTMKLEKYGTTSYSTDKPWSIL